MMSRQPENQVTRKSPLLGHTSTPAHFSTVEVAELMKFGPQVVGNPSYPPDLPFLEHELLLYLEKRYTENFSNENEGVLAEIRAPFAS